jgi:isoleucyl-tRNA synthetase
VHLSGADKEDVELWRSYKQLLPTLFIVSQVEVGEPSDTLAFNAGISRAEGAKCARCWNYSTRVGENSRYLTVCERCSAALAEIESSAEASGAVPA